MSSAQRASAQDLEPPIPGHLLSDERNTIEVFRLVSNSVVFIKNTELRRTFFSRNVMEIPRGTGSGFVWDDQGHIVTNFHVVRDGNAFTVTLADGTAHDAELVGYDPNKDLAVLHIDPSGLSLKGVELGDSGDLLVGQKVLAIGNPFGLDQTLTTGVISALGREIQSVAGTTISDVIQTDAPINPGNSGGPLLDSSGQLIGVNTAIYSPSGSNAGIGFAVPASTVKRIVPQLIEYGKPKRAGLGISIIPDDLAQRWGIQGVIIRDVVRGSPADKAGLQGSRVDQQGRVYLGDIIVGIDDHQIASYDDLYTTLDGFKPGDPVTIHYLRDDAPHEVKLRLEELQ